MLAANSPRGLWDEPDASASWRVRIVQADDDGAGVVLTEAEKPWLIDAFDAAIGQLQSDGNAIVADADFGAVHHTGERSTRSDTYWEAEPSPLLPDVSLS